MSDRFCWHALLMTLILMIVLSDAAGEPVHTCRNGSREEHRVAVTADDAANLRALQDIPGNH